MFTQGRRIRICALAAFTLSLLGACASGHSGVRSLGDGSGLDGLAQCPSRPSCVSSRDTDERHAIAPLEVAGNGAAALLQVREVLGNMPRTKIVSINDRYLHATQASRLFRYTDDVEFLLDAESGRIQVRSSRGLGISISGSIVSVLSRSARL